MRSATEAEQVFMLTVDLSYNRLRYGEPSRRDWRIGGETILDFDQVVKHFENGGAETNFELSFDGKVYGYDFATFKSLLERWFSFNVGVYPKTIAFLEENAVRNSRDGFVKSNEEEFDKFYAQHDLFDAEYDVTIDTPYGRIYVNQACDVHRFDGLKEYMAGLTSREQEDLARCIKIKVRGVKRCRRGGYRLQTLRRRRRMIPPRPKVRYGNLPSSVKTWACRFLLPSSLGHLAYRPKPSARY